MPHPHVGLVAVAHVGRGGANNPVRTHQGRALPGVQSMSMVRPSGHDRASLIPMPAIHLLHTLLIGPPRLPWLSEFVSHVITLVRPATVLPSPSLSPPTLRPPSLDRARRRASPASPPAAQPCRRPHPAARLANPSSPQTLARTRALGRSAGTRPRTQSPPSPYRKISSFPALQP